MTGAVSTRTLDTGKDFKLPAASIYKSIEDQIAARARGEDGVKRLSTSEYARQVVKDVRHGVNGSTWRGGMASVVKFVASYAPVRLWVSAPSVEKSAEMLMDTVGLAS